VDIAPRQPVPIMPLRGMLLFPRTRLPVHVFELRFRTMVRDALSGERLLALSLVRPGWEGEDAGVRGWFPLGCLARFDTVEWLPDDCYDLRLLGVARIRFERATREYPYRLARVSIVPQEPVTEDDPLVELERRALLDAWARTMRREGATSDPAEPLPLEALVNAVCMSLDLNPAHKMRLFEMDNLIERARHVRECMEERLRHPERDPGEGERN
jgi:Lon protease-like protein